MHGLPMDAAMISGGALLIFSLVCFRRFGRLAIFGLAVSIWTLFVCSLPTVWARGLTMRCSERPLCRPFERRWSS